MTLQYGSKDAPADNGRQRLEIVTPGSESLERLYERFDKRDAEYLRAQEALTRLVTELKGAITALSAALAQQGRPVNNFNPDVIVEPPEVTLPTPEVHVMPGARERLLVRRDGDGNITEIIKEPI